MYALFAINCINITKLFLIHFLSLIFFFFVEKQIMTKILLSVTQLTNKQKNVNVTPEYIKGSFKISFIKKRTKTNKKLTRGEFNHILCLLSS